MSYIFLGLLHALKHDTWICNHHKNHHLIMEKIQSSSLAIIFITVHDQRRNYVPPFNNGANAALQSVTTYVATVVFGILFDKYYQDT